MFPVYQGFTNNAYVWDGTGTWIFTQGNVGNGNHNTLTWTQNVYYGAAVAPGSFTAAFIQSLPNSYLALSRATTFTVLASTGQSIFYAYRAAYDGGGGPSFWAFGWSGGMSLAATVSVTNDQGFTEDYNIYQYW